MAKIEQKDLIQLAATAICFKQEVEGRIKRDRSFLTALESQLSEADQSKVLGISSTFAQDTKRAIIQGMVSQQHALEIANDVLTLAEIYAGAAIKAGKEDELKAAPALETEMTIANERAFEKRALPNLAKILSPRLINP